MRVFDREIDIARAMLREPLKPMARQEWWRGCVLYQVYLRSFKDASGDGIGDLRGVVEKLDYIRDLNVDGLWLTPFYPSPQKDFGYDIVDFRNVDERHGSMEDFVELLEEAHKRDLKVLIDFIPAHTSDEHPWFKESRSSRNNPKADWYIWSDASKDGAPPSNWLSSFGGPAWEWEPRRSQYYYHPFLTCQPALNLHNEETLKAVLHQMEFWFDRGVDGMRFDAVQCLSCDPDFRSNPPVSSSGSSVLYGGGPNNPFGKQAHLFDRDVPEALDIVARMRDVADRYEPERILIGELADTDSSRLSDKYTTEGQCFHAVYDFDLINTGPDVKNLSRLLEARSAFLRTGWLMNVFSNHDSKRSVSNMTEFAVDAGRRRDAAKLLLFMQFSLRGGGIIYQGEELGLPQAEVGYEDLQDPWGRNLWPDFEGRDGARTPMPWSADGDAGGFSTGEPWLPVVEEHLKLAVDRQEADPESNLRFVRDFLAWRREQPVLKWGGERVHGGDCAPLIVWDRYGDGRVLTCVANFSLKDALFPCGENASERLVAVPGSTARATDHGVVLGPLAFAMLRSKDRAAALDTRGSA
jgi:alpha-glucosidase